MTNLRVSFVSTSGDAVDAASGATLKDTRIRAIHATGVGDFVITGTSTDPFGTVTGNIIKFTNTTANDLTDQNYGDNGIRMTGTVSVALPVSAATVTIYYG